MSREKNLLVHQGRNNDPVFTSINIENCWFYDEKNDFFFVAVLCLGRFKKWSILKMIIDMAKERP